MKMVPKTILDTDLCKVVFTGTEHQVFIKMSRGGTIEHEPFSGDLRGLVAALQLAIEVCSGKFFPRRVMPEAVRPEATKIEGPRKLSGGTGDMIECARCKKPTPRGVTYVPGVEFYCDACLDLD